MSLFCTFIQYIADYWLKNTKSWLVELFVYNW